MNLEKFYLIRLAKAFFRFHDFDYEDSRVVTKGPIDYGVTGKTVQYLVFEVKCKNCDKSLSPITRENYNNPTFWQSFFCIHNPKARKRWEERCMERISELTKYENLTLKDLENIRRKNTDKKH